MSAELAAGAPDVDDAVRLTAIGAAIGAVLVIGLELNLQLALVLAVLGLAWYLIGGSAFERATALMLMTLPLQSAFVIDLGVTIRLSFQFGVLAAVIGVWQGQLRIPERHPAWYVLGALLIMVTASVLLTPMAPALSFTEQSGLRGIPFLRPIVQWLQLAAMVACMVVTVSYVRTWPQFRRALGFLLCGGLLALAYGFYGFGVLLLGPEKGPQYYIDLNNAMNTDFGHGYQEQGISGMAGYIPRPRSTFPEPLNFANYLLLLIPLLLVFAAWAGRWRRFLWLGIALAALFLFVVSVNSRGALFGGLVALLALVVFARGIGHLLRVAIPTVAALVGALALFVLVAPMIHPVLTPTRVYDYAQFRITTALGSDNRVLSDWAQSVPVVEAHPLFGVGFGNTPFYLSWMDGTAYSGIVDAGGLYTRLLMELGITGVFVYLLFLALLLRGLVHVGRSRQVPGDRRLVAVMLFGVLIADGVQRLSLVGIATDVHLWVLFGLAVALPGLAASSPAGGTAATAQDVP